MGGINISKASLLVIEGDEPTRAGMKRLLNMYGYQVGAVANMRQATKIVQLEKYDLIILDTNLPPPVSFSAAYKIHRQPELQNIPLIAISVHRNSSISLNDPLVDEFAIAYFSHISCFDELEELTACLLKFKTEQA